VSGRSSFFSTDAGTSGIPSGFEGLADGILEECTQPSF